MLVIGHQRHSATKHILKKNLADRELKVDLENQKFALYEDLKGYCSPWDTLFVS